MGAGTLVATDPWCFPCARFGHTNLTAAQIASILASPLVQGEAGSGQKYIEILLKDKQIQDDLFLLAAAWNGGPGNLNKWRRRTNYMGDPLFFIESLPSRETRIFIERVLSNLWIYRNRLDQRTPSLDAIAAGEWPVYVKLGQHAEELAESDGPRN